MSPFKGIAYAPVLQAIHSACFESAWSLQNFQQLLALDTTFGFMTEYGFLLASDLGDDLEILTLAVLPDYRRQGIAASFLSALQEYALSHHKQHIFLEVKKTNQPAICLYQKHGFIQSGIRPDYYHENGQTVDALCFVWAKEKAPN